MALAIPEDESVEKLDALLEELGTVDTDLRSTTAEFDAKIAKLKEAYSPDIDGLTARRDLLVDGVQDLIRQHWDFLMSTQKGKTLVMRGGTIALRKAQPELAVDDEDAAIKSLKRLGKLRSLTRVGKRSLDKVAIKKQPELIARMKGVRLIEKENMIITLARTRAEIKKSIKPFKRKM